METTMRKTILTVLAASLMAASTAQIAVAGEHHHVRKAPTANPQFRNANNAVAWPAQPGGVSDYSEGHVISAPAGH
jgi:hypothetical protein